MASLTGYKSARGVVAGDAGAGLTELAELAIGDEQSSERTHALECLVSMLLGSVFINGRARGADDLGVEMLRLPDEVLQQVALVLGQEKLLGLVYHIADIGH